MTHSAVTPPNPELAALPDLFLLNPKNRAFLEGMSGGIAVAKGSNWDSLGFLLLLSGMGFIGLHALSSAPAVLSILGVVIAASGIVVWGGVRRQQKKRVYRLEKAGQLLIGRLLRTEVIVKDGGEGGDEYYVRFRYCFQTPLAYEIVARVDMRTSWSRSQTYSQLKKDTPVAVLYLDDNCYQVL